MRISFKFNKDGHARKIRQIAEDVAGCEAAVNRLEQLDATIAMQQLRIESDRQRYRKAAHVDGDAAAHGELDRLHDEAARLTRQRNDIRETIVDEGNRLSELKSELEAAEHAALCGKFSDLAATLPKKMEQACGQMLQAIEVFVQPYAIARELDTAAVELGIKAPGALNLHALLIGAVMSDVERALRQRYGAWTTVGYGQGDATQFVKRYCEGQVNALQGILDARALSGHPMDESPVVASSDTIMEADEVTA